jgi:hypothetical protein
MPRDNGARNSFRSIAESVPCGENKINGMNSVLRRVSPGQPLRSKIADVAVDTRLGATQMMTKVVGFLLYVVQLTLTFLLFVATIPLLAGIL